MFNHFYDLKSEAKLPQGAKFVDPYDRTTFTVNPSENLQTFLKRIQNYRETKNYPQIIDIELRPLVVTSFYESTEQDKRAAFFELKAVPATFTQITSLARTIATESINQNTITGKQREHRAAKCLGCVFHRTNGVSKPRLTKVVTKLVGLSRVSVSENEEKLGQCGMCGCELKAKVRFQLISVLSALLPEQVVKLVNMYKAAAFSKCWILEESLEHVTYKDLIRKKLKAAGGDAEKFLDEHINSKIKATLNGARK